MKNTTLISSVMFIYYFIFVTIGFFFSRQLTTLGLPLELVGSLAVIGLVCLVISLVINGFITDNYINNKNLIISYLCITFFCFLTFNFSTNIYVLSIVYSMIWFFFMSLTSMVDGLALNGIEQSKYPLIRAAGSIGAAFSFFLNSWVLDGVGFSFILILNSILIIIMIILIFNICGKFTTHKIKYMNGLKIISKNRNIILILLITFFTYGVIAADDAFQVTFGIDYAQLSSFTLGIVGFLSMLLESIIMLFYYKIEKYIPLKSLFFICVITLFFIFITKYLYYDIKIIVIIGNIMLGLFLGLFIPMAISVINLYTDISIRNTILSLYQAFIKLGGAFLGAFTTAYIAFGEDLPSIYKLHSIILIIPFILIIFLKINSKKDNS